MPRHLLLRLEAPLVAFGGETIDNHGIIRDFPALSMITGLLANALGWRREDDRRHNQLQQRIVMGSRIECVGDRITDYQTALLYEHDQCWTSHGSPEGRAKSPSYSALADGRKALTWQRYRDYHAARTVLTALRLEPAGESPTLDDLAEALDRPARPLFIGRKTCLPTARLFHGWSDSDNLLEVLQTATATVTDDDPNWLLQWVDGEGELPGDQVLDVCDERNWTSGVHGGWRPVRQASYSPGRT